MTWTPTAFTRADVAEFLEAIAAAPASDLKRHAARLSAAGRLRAIDQAQAARITSAIASRRAQLAGDGPRGLS